MTPQSAAGDGWTRSCRPRSACAPVGDRTSARAVERWEEWWRTHGVDPAPAADDPWVEQLAERMARPIVVVAEATTREDGLVDAAPAAPVVVVERTAS